MAIFAIIREGVVANVLVADAWPGGVDITNIEPKPGKGWSYTEGTFTAPPPPAPIMVTDVSRADLLGRMTPVELHAWRRAAQRAMNTDSPVAADRNALYAWMRWDTMSGTVNLDNDDIKGLRNVWIALGMTPARATEILTPLTQ